MLSRPLVLALAGAISLAPAPRARAAGVGIPDLGTKGVSEAGATIAAPDGVDALYYDPAALTSIDGLRAQMDARATRVFVRFQRTEADGTNPHGWNAVENTGATSVAPFVGVACRLRPIFGVPVVVSLGGHPLDGYTGYRYPDPAVVRARVRKEAGPNASDAVVNDEVDVETPQRYASIASDSAIYVPVLAAAAEVTKHVSLGAGLQLPVASIASRQSVYAGPTSGEDPGLDGILQVRGFATTVSGIVGASASAGDFRLGLALQLPMRFVANGTVSADLPPELAGQISLEGSRATVDVTFPWVARAGVRLVRRDFEVELAGTYEAWHQQATITLTPHDVSVVFDGKKTPLPAFVIHQDLVDAGSLRLGGEWHPGGRFPGWKWLTVRAGVLAESSAVPEPEQSLSIVAWERLGLSCGLAARLGRYEISAGYSRLVSPTRRVRDSEVRQLSALGARPEVVGDGDYDGAVDLVGATVAATF